MSDIKQTIDDCFTFENWHRDFLKSFYSSGDLEEQMHGHTAYSRISRATALFSLIALRKVDEFSSDKSKLSGDLRYYDYGLDLSDVFPGISQLLTCEERKYINKHIAHVTEYGELEDDLVEGLLSIISTRAEDLRRLKKVIEGQED